MILFVFFADFSIVFLSSGFIVWQFIISMLVLFSSFFAVFSASYSIGPVAIIVRSFPVLYISAFPILNGVFFVVIIGVFSLANLMYTGPLCFIAAFIAFFVSCLSHGDSTVRFGSTLVIAMSSSAWCVAPSGPTDIPACAPIIFTFAFV